MTNTISNSDDVIDSRDVIARLDELQDLYNAQEEAREARDGLDEDASEDEITEADEALDAAENAFSKEEEDEYKALKALAEEAEGYADDWRHGAILIRESYFADYCEEMVKDIGDLPKDIPGYLVIDWDATADNLRVDYTEVDYDGVTYLVR